MRRVKTIICLAKWLTLYISACCCFRINLVGISRQAQSWLLFLRDEGVWKICNQILLEVLMNRTKHFDLSGSLTTINDLLSVSTTFFWNGLLGAISR